jgi:hypothetical protein
LTDECLKSLDNNKDGKITIGLIWLKRKKKRYRF